MLCSKLKCQTRGKVIRSFGEYVKWIEGDSPEHPIEVLCPRCNKNGDGYIDGSGGCCSLPCAGSIGLLFFPFVFEIGKHYLLRGTVYMYVGGYNGFKRCL